MVFKWIINIFKHFLSALNKDARSQHRAESFDRKEKGNIQRSAAAEKVIYAKERKFEAELEDFEKKSRQLSADVELTRSQAKKYVADKKVADKESVNIKSLSENFKVVVSNFRGILNWCHHSVNELGHFIKIIEDNLGVVDNQKELLNQEKRALRKETRGLRRSFRQKKQLNQDAKLAIIKQKLKINLRLSAIFQASGTSFEKLKGEYEKILEDFKGQVKSGEEINRRLNDKISKWNVIISILKKIGQFVEKDREITPRAQAVNKLTKEINDKDSEHTSEAWKLIGKKSTLDKEYDHLLVQEEIERQKEERAGMPLAA